MVQARLSAESGQGRQFTIARAYRLVSRETPTTTAGAKELVNHTNADAPR